MTYYIAFTKFKEFNSAFGHTDFIHHTLLFADSPGIFRLTILMQAFHDNHLHFICDVCEKTFCLDDVTVPEVKLPKSFTPSVAAMVVNGVCGDCKN